MTYDPNTTTFYNYQNSNVYSVNQVSINEAWTPSSSSGPDSGAAYGARAITSNSVNIKIGAFFRNALAIAIL